MGWYWRSNGQHCPVYHAEMDDQSLSARVPPWNFRCKYRRMFSNWFPVWAFSKTLISFPRIPVAAYDWILRRVYHFLCLHARGNGIATATKVSRFRPVFRT